MMSIAIAKPLSRIRRLAAAVTCTSILLILPVSPAEHDDDDDPCLLYLAQSTIPNGKHAPMVFRLLSHHFVRRTMYILFVILLPLC